MEFSNDYLARRTLEATEHASTKSAQPESEWEKLEAFKTGRSRRS